MSASDPISDMLANIKNGQNRGKITISIPSSKLKIEIAKLLKNEGYISGFLVINDSLKSRLEIKLKYYRGKPVIEYLKRISRPGLRFYCSKNDLPRVCSGLGVAIISTSKGLMTDRAARLAGLGGEVLALVA